MVVVFSAHVRAQKAETLPITHREIDPVDRVDPRRCVTLDQARGGDDPVHERSSLSGGFDV
jgi:hypothetical protein